MRLHLITWVLVLATLGVLATSVRAQSSGGPYRFDKSVIAGGGGVANGGNYRFASTPGQATTARISGASYVFYGGFWTPSAPASDAIFANGFDP